MFGVEPDMIVTAKGLGGGLYPISATLMTEHCQQVFDEDPFAHVSTMGGAECGCVVAEKVLDICTRPAFLDNVRRVSQRMYERMLLVQSRLPDDLLEVRRVGMFMGLKFNHDLGGMIMMKTSFEAGLLCWVAGHDRTVLQFLPPLLIDEALADEIVDRMTVAIERFHAIRGGSAA